MRLAIDARLNAYRRGGIPEYTRQLLTALAPLVSDDTLISLQHRRQRRPLVPAPNVRRATLCTPPHHRLEQWALPAELLCLRLDLLHCPDFIAPRRRTCPAVVTVPDLAFLHYPDILDDAARRYYSQVRTAVWDADAVIAISQTTKDDITTLLGLPPERIDVTYLAAAPLFQPLRLDPVARRTINEHNLIAGTFALFVSTLEPRKNIPTLLRALRVCLDRRPSVPYHLVLAGARGWRDDEVFTTLRDLRLEQAVTLLGGVTQEELVWLYNACRVYVNPSLYEGFGLPVVEAMACGAPTIVADTGSLVEIAGNAAPTLPVLDVAAWADAISQFWDDEALRHDATQRGQRQAARFSWETTARETLAIYRRVL